MAEIMNGYELMAPFTNKGAGFSRWTLASRDKREFFMKEFISPVYPLDMTLSDKIKQQRIEECEDFEKKKTRLYESINELSDGNIVRINEFFRCDSHYYISTERIISQSISFQEMQKYSMEDRLLLCRIIAHAIMKLHGNGIVHADLKSNNILLKYTQMNKITAKIIDFDCSFFEDDPPQYEDELGGDQVYLAPEACLFMCGEPIELSCKIDVFSLGLIFHQILTGDFPQYNTDKYDYAFEAVLDKQQLEISSSIDRDLRKLLKRMLVSDPNKRINMEEVFLTFKQMDGDSEEENVSTNSGDTPKPPTGSWFYTAGDL